MHRLVAHPAHPPRKVRDVRVRWSVLPSGSLMLRWRVDGAEDVVMPPYAGSGRADELWRTTCFELFLSDSGGRYREFNFSPSGQWAAYEFSSYRHLTGNYRLGDPPFLEVQKGETIATATVRLPVDTLDGAHAAGFSVVIEEEGGHLSYWSVVHRREKPDFHDPACFVIRFAAAEQS